MMGEINVSYFSLFLVVVSLEYRINVGWGWEALGHDLKLT